MRSNLLDAGSTTAATAVSETVPEIDRPQPSSPQTEARVHTNATCDKTTTTEVTTARTSSTPKSESTVVATPTATATQKKRRHRVAVKSIMGTTHEVKLRETDSVRRIKEKVAAVSEIPTVSQQLLFAGRELSDELATVSQLGIGDGSTLTLVVKAQSGQLEMVEGLPVDEETLYEKVLSQLSEQQIDELTSGALDKPVTLVANISGKRVLVRVKPNPAVAAQQSESNENDVFSGDSTLRQRQLWRDPQWRKDKQGEHQDMRSKVDRLRAEMQARKAAAQAAPVATPTLTPIPASTTAAVSTPALVSTSTAHASAPAAKSSSKGSKCHCCKAKLPLVSYPCKCGEFYCGSHRHSHACSHDYRAT